VNILVIWPPHVPTYFNEGHRVPLFMVGAFLRRLPQVGAVRCVDAGALNYTWKDVANLIVDEPFDVVIIMNEFGVADAVGRMAQYVQHLSRRSKLVTFGRLSGQIPTFFQRYGFDAIVAQGDYESGVAAYIQYLAGARADVPGVYVREGGSWTPPPQGVFLDPEEWAFPDINEIPYRAYDQLYLDDSRKFCGIPERRELVVPVARGCPVNCSYCEVPRQQGLKERRRSVASVISYIEESFRKMPFEYVTFYAPTFTLNRAWVEQLCDALIDRGARYPWKCVTTVFHLDKALVEQMSRSGCVRISVGLETLDVPAKASLPRLKQVDDARFYDLAVWCSESRIELNCFIILGLPGQTVAGARFTMEQVRAAGARVRPTIYTPYEDLRPEMDERAVMSYDRQFFPKGLLPSDDEAALYRLAFGNEQRPTQVMANIPQRIDTLPMDAAPEVP
jgi:radical SAM superfamily enzyme YgiQ (UPF0313 family)